MNSICVTSPGIQSHRHPPDALQRLAPLVLLALPAHLRSAEERGFFEMSLYQWFVGS